MGVKAVESHLQSEKHKLTAKSQKQTSEILQFLLFLILLQQESPHLH